MTRDSLTQTEEDALITVALHRFVRHGSGILRVVRRIGDFVIDRVTSSRGPTLAILFELSQVRGITLALFFESPCSVASRLRLLGSRSDRLA